MKCPCCGSDIASPPDVWALDEVDDQPQVVAVLNMLAGRYPRSVSIHLMVDHLYGALPNGGPDDASRVIRVIVSRARKAIQPLGWNINRHKGAGYRLEKVDAS